MMTEEDKSLLDGSFDGDTISIQTWEEACATSQEWADKARKHAVFRRQRRNSIIVITLVTLLVIAASVAWVLFA
jgi:hypothetical protein